MNSCCLRIYALGIAVLLCGAGRARAAQFIVSTNAGDEFYSVGVTSNGVVRITGLRNDIGGVFEWSGTGFHFTPLGPLLTGSEVAWPNRISPDGMHIVGFSESPNTPTAIGYEAALWDTDAPGTPIGLGFLNPIGNLRDSIAYGVATRNGEVVVVGFSTSSLGTIPFEWTPSNGMSALPLTGLPHQASGAHAVSPDGSVWCGVEQIPSPDALRGVVGTSFNALALNTMGALGSYANAFSRDGKMILGGLELQPLGAEVRAAYWSGSNYVPSLISMDGAPVSGTAQGSDAGLVVGIARRASGGTFGWIASLTNGVALTASNWLAQHYGLIVTNTITFATDILQKDDRLLMVFQTSSGGALFSTDIPPPPPTLSIFQLPPGQIELRWPTNQSCTVEATLSLAAPPEWTPLTNAVPLLTNSQFVLTLPVTNTASFFRLRCP